MVRSVSCLILILGLLSTVGCASSKPEAAPKVEAPSVAGAYGLSPDNPVRVGGVADQRGPANERAYLDLLEGPSGQAISYERTGNCCAFETPNGTVGNVGLLDVYEVTYPGLEKPIEVYINMYDDPVGPPTAPKGLRLKR